MTTDGTPVVAWRGADLAVRVSRALAAPERIVGDVTGAVAASTVGNNTIVAWTALPQHGDVDKDGRVEATAAAAGEYFGAPVILTDGYARQTLAAAVVVGAPQNPATGGDAVVWIEIRGRDSGSARHI